MRPNGADARSTGVAIRHDAEVGLGGLVLASSASSSRRADGPEGAGRTDGAALEDEVLGVLVTVGVAWLVDEPDEPQAAATDTQRTTAATAAQPRRGFTAMPERTPWAPTAGEPRVPTGGCSQESVSL